MKRVYEHLYVGSRTAVPTLPKDAVLLNVSSKYHYQLLGWTHGQPVVSSANYITLERENLLSINWVDGAARYYDYQGKGVQVCQKILDFIDSHYKKQENVYIFCDFGESRSPSVALLYLAKRIKGVSDASYQDARKDFTKLYPDYRPGGIRNFLTDKWTEII